MKFLASIVLLVVAVSLPREGHAHTYSLGSCPLVEPMSGFQMSKFLGEWYVIQKTSTASHCITYNFTRGEEPGEYVLEQTSQHFALGLSPLEHNYHYTGKLSVPDAATPAKMKVRFPLNPAGSATYTIFMTDYETYAGIFTCQKLAFAHRESATILSRTKTLDKAYIDKIRTRLSTSNVDPFDLSIISQNGCPKDDTAGVNLNIDSETFTPQSAAGVIRKVGEKIGDGVEYIAEGAKKLYGKIVKDDDDKGSERLMKPDPDSEWLP